MFDDNDSTTRRNAIKYLGMCAALAAAPVANGRRNDDEDEDRDEDEDEAPEASDNEDNDEGVTPEAVVDFDDQNFGKGRSAEFVKVDRFETNVGAYISIHDYTRFQVAEGREDEFEERDIPEPTEREFPVCESLIGISEFFEPGEYRNVKVPVLEDDSPAVELGAREEGRLESSQPLLCIPHQNNTDPDEFTCPDDPNTPNNSDEFDGAFSEGEFDVDGIPVSHDLALVTRGPDDEETKELAARMEQAIRDGVLVPQPVTFGEDEEADEDENEDEDDEEDENDDLPEADESVPTGKFEDDVHGELTVNVERDGEGVARHPVEMNGDQFRTDENGQSFFQLGDGHDNPTVVNVVVGDQSETVEVDHDDNDDVSITFEV